MLLLYPIIKEKTVTDFVRHYLAKGSDEVRQNDIYFQIKKRIDTNNVLTDLKDLCTFAEYYSRLLQPDREPNVIVRKYLHRLKRLDFKVIYPFLLNCYDDWMKSRMTEQEFISVLQVVENFILRRFVCGILTHSLGSIFTALYTQVRKDTELHSGNFVERLKSWLQNRGYPKDEEFRARLVDVKLYEGNRTEKGKLILEAIEEHLAPKEQVPFDKLSVEHIMPQTLNEAWKASLGENYAITHELLCHTIGNLTLTEYNQELSNSTFEQKKESLKKSRLKLNEYFQNKTSWRREDIEERAKYLADIALRIWSYFGHKSTQPSQPIIKPSNITGTTPKSLYFLGQKHSVKSWRDVMEITLNTIADEEPDAFAEVIQQFPRFVGWDAKDFCSTRRLSNGAFIEVQLSAQDIYKFCIKAIETAGLSTEEWNVQTQES
jgi:hypothetical protein